jgi:peptidyl-prolyl cis-trans isomerase SurA
MKTLPRILLLSALLLVLKMEAEYRLQAQAPARAGLAPQTGFAAHAVFFPATIVAVVNDRVILDSEVRQKVSPQTAWLREQYQFAPQTAALAHKLQALQVEALDDLVNEELILAEAAEAGRQVPQEHVDHYIEGLIQTNYFGDSNAFFKALTAQDTTVEDLRERHRQSDLMAAARQEKIANLPPSTAKQIEEYYRSHEKEFRVEESVRLSIITLFKKPIDTRSTVEPQRKLAAELLAILKAGRDFAEVAAVYSQGSQRQKGGDFGWVERPVLRKELADVAFLLKPGELSEVIETAEELYILRVADRRPGALKPLADVQEDIRKTLQAEERSAVVKQWLDRLRATTFIRYFGDLSVDSVSSQGRVAKIEIKHVGTSAVSDALIRAHFLVKQGEPVRRSSVDRSIRRLYATGDFQNIRVSAKDADGETTLTYFVQERPVLSDIRFTGNKALSNPELLRKLASKTGERLDERKMFKDALAIESLYQKAGYPQATVKYAVKADEHTGQGSIAFEITEKPSPRSSAGGCPDPDSTISSERQLASPQLQTLKSKSTARLHVILAREAPLAVVLRRRPARQVCTALWNCRTDEFTLARPAEQILQTV